MIVVFIVVLVVFGPQKLPELARGLGKLMAEFRKASFDFKSAFEEEMRDLERQAREVERRKAEAATAAASAATPEQPATQGTPSGVETQAPGSELAADDTDTRLTEASAVEPVPEAVPRSTEPSNGANPAPDEHAVPSDSPESTHEHQ